MIYDTSIIESAITEEAIKVDLLAKAVDVYDNTEASVEQKAVVDFLLDIKEDLEPGTESSIIENTKKIIKVVKDAVRKILMYIKTIISYMLKQLFNLLR
jgi:hypothetical protein